MKTFFSVFLISQTIACIAQNRSNNWQLGDNPSMGTTYPGYGIDFNDGFADTFTVYRPMRIFITDASICDTTGQLLFYTNGVYISNRNHDSLLNCKDFNPGYFTDFYGDGGMGFSQAAIILPGSGSNTKYWIFSITSENFSPVQPFHLSVSEIDMDLDAGLGGISASKKNIHVIVDTLSQGRITACKHANGRDWWIIIHKYYSDLYYKVLVMPDTLKVFTQQIGNKFTSNDINGMAVFSPDGSKYAHLNINDTIDLLQFDRCTGDFYDPIYLSVPDSPVTLSATLGCQFSPNSRFLYVNSYRRLWQFDTWAGDVQASLILIDTTNNFEDKFLQQLAPDSKIYVGTRNSNGLNPFLNVIHNPDELGLDCNFEIEGLPLPPTTTNSGIPNFPNYDLGPLIGSPCDTLFNQLQTIAEDFQIKFSPNPASSLLNIEYHSNEVLQFKLFDVTGVLQKEITLYPYFRNRMLHVEDLADGIYLAEVTSQNKMIKTEKVVVQH